MLWSALFRYLVCEIHSSEIRYLISQIQGFIVVVGNICGKRWGRSNPYSIESCKPTILRKALMRFWRNSTVEPLIKALIHRSSEIR